MTKTKKLARIASLAMFALLVSCGGGGGGGTSAASGQPPPAVMTFAVGGTVTGLSAATSVTLKDNASDSVTVSANGSFTFATKLASGAAYAVTIASAPSGETCSIAGATGTIASSAVTSVVVTCMAPVAEWTWQGGAQTANALSVYGTLGVASAGNTPGAREEPVTWTDSAGNLWLFGGGTDPSALGGTEEYFGDLWSFSPLTRSWTWVGGSSSINSAGSYGPIGVASPTNTPGARMGAERWTDADGNFWLYGGSGYDSTGSFGILGDLWKFSTSTRQWTWVAGSNAALAHPVYGTIGTAAAGNTPGGRSEAVTWVDANGVFWLFGGGGFDSTGAHGSNNELWRYAPSTGQWTWMSGSNVAGAMSNFGTKGQAAAGNVPGARLRSSSWTDAAGHLWLFSGQYVSQTTGNQIPTTSASDDLWEYDITSGLWTWVAGSQTANGGTYGTLGVASPTNDPGPRVSSYAAIDSSGDFLLFGGYGSGPATTGVAPPPNGGVMNDLWRYSPDSGQWTWVAGSSMPDALPDYGTLGVGSTSTLPGGRAYGGAWGDGAGHLWIFGGIAIEASGTQPADDNSLWDYQF